MEQGHRVNVSTKGVASMTIWHAEKNAAVKGINIKANVCPIGIHWEMLTLAPKIHKVGHCDLIR